MSGDVHVRFCERPEGRFLRATRLLLFADNKPQLWNWKREIMDFLAGLRLTLHEKSSTVYPVSHGVPFLGFRLYPEYRRLKRKNGVNFERRLRRFFREYERGELSRDEMNRRVRGWIAHVEYANTWGLRRSLFSRTLPLSSIKKSHRCYASQNGA